MQKLARSWRMEDQLECIQNLLANFKYDSTGHVLRIGNKVADWLAN